ncbi:MAG: radical SAM protein [Candidatus Thermoplasmatota archaeon]
MGSRALERYYRVLAGEERARYLACRERRTDADLSASTDELWAAHRRALRGGDGDGADLLSLKAELAERLQSECVLCERRCRARRGEGQAGHCEVLDARVTSEFIHMGEEPDLVPSYTVFFAGCTFDCVYCQNWEISTRPRSGIRIPPDELARMIEGRAGRARGLRTAAARNVNWVGGDPTSNLPYILRTLQGCDADIAQVWNSNMYLSEEAMELLDPVVDVYLTDFKYGNDACAMRLSGVPEYMRVVTRNHLKARAHAEMIIRHLVLPGHVECCTRPALEWIASNLVDVKVNVMAQYRPEHRAREFPEISRRLRTSEYEEAVRIADGLGLEPAD